MRYNLGFELNNVVATPVILNQKYIRLSTCEHRSTSKLSPLKRIADLSSASQSYL